MIRVLQLIKKNLPFVWNSIEFLNGIVIEVFYGRKIKNAHVETFETLTLSKYQYRTLHQEDLIHLENMLTFQPKGFDDYFKPHCFDSKTLKMLLKNPAFQMFGVFDGEKIIGYFFLRFFLNRKAFRGKMVDVAYQGKGIAKEMGKITTDIAYRAGFRLFATISKFNYGSMASSAAVNKIHVIKELPKDYVYIEYFKNVKTDF